VNDRVRLGQEASGEWTLHYRRYNVARVIRTGTHDEREAERMADELAEGLEREQVEKMRRREDWRPPGLTVEPPAPPPSTAAAPFNPPRVR